MNCDGDSEVIPWEQLEEEKKDAFVSAFMRDEARFARIHKGVEWKGGRNEFVATALYRHQREREFLRRLSKAFHEEYWNGDRERAAKISELKDEVKSDLNSTEFRIHAMLKLWLMGGEWHRFKWLADYGRKHAPNGISDLAREIETTFPEHCVMTNPHREPSTLAQTILWEFVLLSGCDQKLLIADPEYPPGTLTGIEGAMHRAMTGEPEPKAGVKDWLLPPRLPTKKRLKASVIEVWESIQRKATDNLSSQFSAELGTLGLDGLPAGKRGPGEDGGFAG